MASPMIVETETIKINITETGLLTDRSPGSTFIIRSVSCGRVITLYDGQITLAELDNPGSIFWFCVRSNGWFGFQNVASGKFLGCDETGRLCCIVKHHLECEFFTPAPTSEGRCILRMKQGGKLCPVGIKAGIAKDNLAKIEDTEYDGLVFEFRQIEDTEARRARRL